MGHKKPAVVLPPSAPTLTTEQLAAWGNAVITAHRWSGGAIFLTRNLVLAMDGYIAALEEDNDSLRGHG